MNKPNNIDKVMSSIRYFLEHLEYLLLQQSDPMARTKLFGPLFDKLPNYQDLISGTAKLSPVIELNQLFIQKNVSSGLIAGHYIQC
ncbi:MAG TPA: hypothetical protein VGF75_04965 [Candidatus Saccharimonadales bacterium]|jgi:hypothetical protein